MNKSKRRRALKRALALMCAVVIFLTAGILKHDANTYVRTASCGYPDHEHTLDCYNDAGELTCELHVHTDACYQGGAEAEAASAEIDAPVAEVASAEIDAPVAEAEALELGEAEDLPEEIAPEQDDAMAELEPEYAVGDQPAIALSALLRALDLRVDGVVGVGQAVDDGAPVMIDVTRVGEDFEIRPLDAFDEIELAIETEDDIVLVRLTDARPQPDAAEAWAVDETPAEDLGDEQLQAPEYDDEYEEAADAGVAVEAVDAAEETVELLSSAEDSEATVESIEPEEMPEVPSDDEALEADIDDTKDADDEAALSDAEDADDEAALSDAEDADDEARPSAEIDAAEAENNEDGEAGDAIEEKPEADGAAIAEKPEADGVTDNDKPETDGEEMPEAEGEALPADEGEADAEAPALPTYVFGEEKTVRLSEVLSALELTAELSDCEVGLSGNAPIRLEFREEPFDCLLTAEDYFDSAVLRVTSDEGALEILLSNPETGVRMSVGEAMTSENGAATVVFGQDILLPEGTELTAEASEPELDEATRAEIEAQLKEALGDTPFEVVWYDVALGDVHDVQATLTLEDAARTDDQVIVVHVREDNDVRIIEDVDVADSGAVTFDTDGFSPIGVVRLLAAESAPITGNGWSLLNGVLTINSTKGTSKTGSNVEWYQYREQITDVVIEEGAGVTSIPNSFLYVSSSPYINLKSVTIPESVTTIGTSAFRYLKALEQVNLPDSLTEIKYRAFQSCTSLTSIHIPAGVKTIGVNGSNSIFPGCTNLKEVIFDEENLMQSLPANLFKDLKSLETVVLPQDLTSLSTSLFSGCTSLEEIDIPKGVTSISSSAFNGCTKLAEVALPKYLESIGSSAFNNTALETVTFPEGVKTIDSSAFANCKQLAEVALPGSVTSLGTGVFSGCSSLETADISAINLTTPTLPASTFSSCSKLESVKLPEGITKIDSSAFSGCTALSVFNDGQPGVLTLPDSVTALGDSAFNNCDALTEVHVPDGVTSFDKSVFGNCDNLVTIELGKGITSIPASFFYNDKKLQTVILNGDVTSIGNSAFQSCAALKNFDLPETLKTIGSSAFSSCTALTKAEFPATLTSIGQSAYSSCSKLSSITFEDGESPLTIDAYAFRYCNALTKAEFPKNLKSIGSQAFYNDYNLKTIAFEDGDEPLTIGSSAFQSCTALTEVDFPKNLSSISSQAFYGDYNLKTIAFEEGDEPLTIENSAFQGCTALTKAEFPKNLSSIGTSAFLNDSNLKTIAFEEGDEPLTIGNNAFQNCSGLTKAELPENLTKIGSAAFSGCSGLTSIEIPNSATDIGASAFSSCSKLTEVKLPESLTMLNSSVFSGCALLTGVELPETLTSIGSSAFYGCAALDEITIPKNVQKIDSAAFSNCWRLDNMLLDAEDCDIEPFKSNTHFTLTIGPDVKNLTAKTLKNLVDGGANKVVFTPGCEFTMEDTSDTGLPRPLAGLSEGTYRADESGALYKIEDNGTATLVYVPDGLTEYTVPATFNGLPVAKVKSAALSAASDLETLTLKAPTALTVEDYGFAFAGKLTHVVSGDTDVTDKASALALFDPEKTGKEVFYKTGLADTGIESQEGALVYGQKNGDSDWGEGLVVTVSQDATSQRVNWDGESPRSEADSNKEGIAFDQDNNSYMLYTGETLKTTITLSNPKSEGEENDPTEGEKVRLYFQMDEGCDFTVYWPQEEPYQAGLRDDTTGETSFVPCYSRKTDVEGLYYIEFDRPPQGKTAFLEIGTMFPNITTGGGKVVVWAEYFNPDDALATANKGRSPGAKNHTIDVCTRRDTYRVTKTNSTSPTVYSSTDGVPYLTAHSYSIKLKKTNSDTLTSTGRDNISSIEYEDTLALPDGIAIDDELAAEFEAGSITIRNESGSKYVVSPSRGNIFSLSSSSNGDKYRMTSVALSEDRQSLTFKWTLRNHQPLTGDVAMPAVTMTVYDNVLRVSKTAEAGKTYTINNNVAATEHFTYSEDVTQSSDASCNIKVGEAKAELTKLGTSGERGEYAPYTLMVKSTGDMPLTRDVFTSIRDTIDGTSSGKRYYIKPEDIWKMFMEDTTGAEFCNGQPLSDALTLTITGCHLYGGASNSEETKLSVTTTDGDTATTSYENTSVEVPGSNKYSGRSGVTNETYKNATFTFTKKGDKLHYALVNEATTIEEGDLVDAEHAENAEDAEDIQTMFARLGFLVTRNTLYAVNWDLTKLDSFSIPSGPTLSLTLPTTLKDTFMWLEGDAYEYASYTTSSKSNTFYLYKDNLSYKSTSVKTTHAQDAKLTKSVNTTKWQKHYQEGFTDAYVPDVLEYTVSAQHIGDATYGVMPITDHMTMRQRLMVKADDNPGLANPDPDDPEQANREVESCKLGDDTYYVLGPGEYFDVDTGNGTIAHRVVVTRNARDAKSYDTKIFWYTKDFGGNSTVNITYKAKLEMNEHVDKADLYNFFNESWLGDHQGHRLYDNTVCVDPGKYAVQRLVTEWDKRIVDRVGDTSKGYKYCPVTKGQRVIYRLSFINTDPGRQDFSINGTQFYDVLPMVYNQIQWTKENVHIEYRGFKTNGDDKWSIQPLDKVTDQYKIKWDDDFVMTCWDPNGEPNGVGYIYVIVDFPDGTDWDTYAQMYGKSTLYNTLHLQYDQINEGTVSVSHDLAEKSVARLQKGVYATGGRINGRDDIFRTGSKARSTYENNDTMTRRVYYYITLQNAGYTNLYLNPIQDVLPKGFTLAGCSLATSGYATVGQQPEGPNVTYLSPTYSHVNTQVTDTADGRKRVSITLVPNTSYSDATLQRNPYMENRYYLKPGQVAVIRLDCYTNEYADTDDVSTNVAAMPVYDFLGNDEGVELADTTSTAVPAGYGDKNDGGCDVISTQQAENMGFGGGYSDATDWMVSGVTLTRGEILPGMDKKLTKNVNSRGYDAGTEVHPLNTLGWTVDAYNEGDSAIMDYAVTDVMPAPFNFTGDVTYKQFFNDDQSNSEVTLFSFTRTTVGSGISLAASDEVVLTNDSGTAYHLTIGQSQPVSVYVTALGRSVQVSMYRDEGNNEVLSIRFPDKQQCIPAGGKTRLVYESRNLSGKMYNSVFVNTACVNPLKQTWPGNANRGKPETLQTPFSEAGQFTQAVSAASQVTTSYGGNTSSMKAIKEKKEEGEKEKKDNAANSEKSPNYITVRDKSRTVVYTLTVKNKTPRPINHLVVIDNLPEPDDHSIFKKTDRRNSAFRVLLSDTPNFRLYYTDENDKDHDVDDDLWRVEWSSETEFDDIDWMGEPDNTRWHVWDRSGLWEDEPKPAVKDIHAIRLVFNDPSKERSKTVFLPYFQMHLDFDAKIKGDDPGAKPGALAWNGFGYHFGMLNMDGVDLEAAPQLVGLRIPDLPHVDKSLVNTRGKGYDAASPLEFEYVVYSGSPLTFTEGTDKDAVIKAIEKAGRSYALGKVTVPGGDHSTAPLDFNTLKGNLYDETSEAYQRNVAWVMDDGDPYTLLELPADDFSPRTLGDQSGGSYAFTFNAAESSKTIRSVNVHDDWSFKVLKRDQFGRAVKGVVFAVYTMQSGEAISDEDYDALTLEDKPDREQSWENTNYWLMSVETTDVHGSFQKDELNADSYMLLELSAPEHYLANGENPAKIDWDKENKTVQSKVITNDYQAEGSASLKFNKALTGRPLQPDEFEFALEAFDIEKLDVVDEGVPMPEVAGRTARNDADGLISFGDIRFTEADIGKTYYYRVHEVVPPEETRDEKLIYDTDSGYARVTVVDKGAGVLDASVDYRRFDALNREVTWDATFNNTFDDDAQFDITVTKTLRDFSWDDVDRFEFDMIRVDDPEDTVTVRISEKGQAPKITKRYGPEDVGRTYEYILRERVQDQAVAYNAVTGEKIQVPKRPGSTIKVDLTHKAYDDLTEAQKADYGLTGVKLMWKYRGMAYDGSEHPVSARVYYSPDTEGIEVEVTVDGQITAAPVVDFLNQFKPDNAVEDITVMKHMVNRPLLREDRFEFRLEPDTEHGDQNHPMPADPIIVVERGKVNNPDSSSTLRLPLPWDALGGTPEENDIVKIFYYKLTEVVPEGADENNRYEQVTYETRVFPVRVKLTGHPDYSMDAEVKYGDPDNAGYDDPDDTDSWRDTPYVANNNYSTDLIGFPVTIDKRLNGKTAHQGKYRFELRDSTGALVDTLELDTSDVKPFPIDVKLGEAVTKPGESQTYTYTLKELDDKAPGVTYDTKEITVTVKITMSSVTYRLVPTVTYSTGSAAVFNNGYESTGEYPMPLKKRIDGRKFREDEAPFTFELIPQDGSPMRTSEGEQEKLTVIADTDNGFETTFDALQYNQDDITDPDGALTPKDFLYTLHEVVPTDATVETDEGTLTYGDADPEQRKQYDGKWALNNLTYAGDQTVTIRVADDGEGHLIFNDGDGIRPIQVKNVYEPNPVTARFSVKKRIVDANGDPLDDWRDGDSDWSDMTFEFTATPALGSPKLPEDEDKAEVTHDQPTAEFGEITFTKAGTYEYTIAETLPLGMTPNSPYDTANKLAYDVQHAVKVVVSDDLKGTLTAKVTYDGADQSTQVFSNRALRDKASITVRKLWQQDKRPVNGPGDPSLDHITLHLYRLAESEDAVEIDADTKLPAAAGKTPKAFTLPKGDNDAWELTIDDLMNYDIKNRQLVVYSYYVVEESVPGWQTSGYFNEASDGDDDGDNKHTALSAAVQNNGVITVVNNQSSVSLPATGGPGTALFTASGLALIALALTLLMRKRRI